VREVNARRPARALALLLLSLGASHARAGDLSLEVDAIAGAGATDNARFRPAAEKVPDAILVGTAAGRLRYRGPLWNHSLGYQISGTYYVLNRGPSGANQNVAWNSVGFLSPKWTLQLGATGTYANMTVFESSDVRTIMPNLSPIGETTYVSASANEALIYDPNPRRKFAQALGVARTHILSSPPDYVLPDSTLVNMNLRGEQQLAIDQFNADLTGSYLNSKYYGKSQDREWILVQALVGWRRDFNLRWSAEGRVGAVGVFLLDGLRGLIAPAFQFSAVYKQERWFANAMIAQTATPNIFGGQATISDMALVRAALPLTRSERYYFMGFASYMYGRAATRAGSTHVFDNRTIGANLTARNEKFPYWASLDYMFTDQSFVGGGPGGQTGVRRHVIMLNVGGTFVFGKGQPSPFRGVL
jgi:hypothetical protein